MERPTLLTLMCLATFLVLLPLTLDKPGWPAGMKADEPAYFLMASSLAHDRDLRCELGDLRRLFDEFPHHPAHNVILMTDDGWNTVYFGKPYVYSLLAAPAVRLFGANGLVSVNMALFVVMVYLGTSYLRRYNPDAMALIFSAGFFGLSVGFAYTFWMQPELFNMTAVTASLYLGLTPSRGYGTGRFHRRILPAWLARGEVREALSCAALGLAVYNKPMLAALGLPVFFTLCRKRQWRSVASYLAGGAVCLGLLMGLAVALTGHPSAYLGVARAGVKICSPDEMPVEPLAPALAAAAEASQDAEPAAGGEPVRGSLADKRRAAWSWIFRLPPWNPGELAEHAGYFLWGRHTGLFLYFPFTLLALLLFLGFSRRSGERWVLLGSLAVVALFFLLWIPFNWHGGGGFVGNRYYTNAYPGFLFLVTRVAPSWIHLVGYALGSVLLGPTIFTPMGRAVPWPTLQAHVRNFPFPLFPLELSVKGIPGYHEARLSGATLRGRKDVFLPQGNRVWIRGATDAEIWIRSAEPLNGLFFEVSSFAEPNDVVLRLGTEVESLGFDEAASAPRRARRRVSLEGPPTRTLTRRGQPLYYYRLLVRSRTGEIREWYQHYPPQDCFYFPYVESTVESFYAGIELSFLGSAERLTRDLYEIRWGESRLPESVAAGEIFKVRTRVRNRSGEIWPVDPPIQVNLAYHWEDEAGAVVVHNGLRTFLEDPVPPGGRVDVEQTVMAPEEPGRYVLVRDLVYEGVSWFAERTDGDVLRSPIEVTPVEGSSEAAEGSTSPPDGI